MKDLEYSEYPFNCKRLANKINELVKEVSSLNKRLTKLEKAQETSGIFVSLNNRKPITKKSSDKLSRVLTLNLPCNCGKSTIRSCGITGCLST